MYAYGRSSKLVLITLIKERNQSSVPNGLISDSYQASTKDPVPADPVTKTSESPHTTEKKGISDKRKPKALSLRRTRCLQMISDTHASLLIDTKINEKPTP